MRSQFVVLGLGLSVPVLASCGPQPPMQCVSIARADLAIVSLSPDRVVSEGGTKVTFELENGCDPSELRVKIGETDVSPVTLDSEGHYSFVAPPAPNLTDKITTSLRVMCPETIAVSRCGYPLTRTKTVDEKPFTYDPALDPRPSICGSYGPTGTNVPVDATMMVLFCQDMDRASVEKPGNISIQGVTGTTTYFPATKTAVFTPTTQLDHQHADGTGGLYTCIVKGGDAGVKSIDGRNLRTTLNATGAAPDPNQDSWSFTTAP